MEHREDGRRADAGAEQDDRARAVAEDEHAARRGDIDHVADLDVVVQVAAACALAFDADPEAFLSGHV